MSISDLEKALEISVKTADGKKIKEVLESRIDLSNEERREKVLNIIKQVGVENFKKSEYAKLLVYTGSFDEGVKNYLAAGNYQKAFKYFNKISEEFRYG